MFGLTGSGVARTAVALAITYVAYEIFMYGGTYEGVSKFQQQAWDDSGVGKLVSNPQFGRPIPLGGAGASTGDQQPTNHLRNAIGNTTLSATSSVLQTGSS